jgi:bacteriocin-like protein
MEKQRIAWKNLSQHELESIYGGGWFDDFKQGFKEGFDWATGVLKDIVSIFK